MVKIAFLWRILGLDRSRESAEVPVEVVPTPEPPALPQPNPPAPVTLVACPNCGVVLEPPPGRTRLCPSCRLRIVVRHSEGRPIYLTEAAVSIFEAQREHEIREQTSAHERRRWLHLARLAGVSAERRRRLAAAPLTAAAVQASRTLYLVAAERAVRSARRDKRWDDVARIRRRQAAALFEEAGNSPPPTDDIVALHRKGVAATLRALATVSRDAELVGASCCPACRADNERIFRIANELRTPRLPHDGCPHGLCACDWWPALAKRATKRRRERVSTSPSAAADGAPPTGGASSMAGASADPA